MCISSPTDPYLVGIVVTEGFSVGAVENGGVDVKLYINK